MVARSVSHISFVVDFDAVAEALGAAEAMFDFNASTRYTENIVHAAWEESNTEFNETAAAYAAGGGGIKHMYEWGTAGINTGRTNLRPNPLSARARLWKPTMHGNGLDQTINYVFKPSVAFVPKPTTRDTGMSAETIALLKDHVFYNKAMVMETGMTVHISPTEAKFLLIPLQNNKSYYAARPNDLSRGYMMTKGPVTLRPGARSVGRFQSFWTNFWNTRGNELLNERVIEQIHLDFDAAIEKPRSSSHLTRPIPGRVASVAKSSKYKTQRAAGRAAAERRKAAELVNAK